MSSVFAGIFIILHGLVHIWYVVLSFNLVEYQPNMGWTGHSWLLSMVFNLKTTKTISGILFSLAALAFIIGGFTIFTQSNTPIIDLKPYMPSSDRVKHPKVPNWVLGFSEWLDE